MNFKRIAIGVVTFGAGVGLGYFACKKKYLDDLADVKQFYYNKIEEMGVQPSDFEPECDVEDDEDDDEEATDDDEEYHSKVLKYSTAVRQEHRGKGRPIINYNKPPLMDMKDWGDLEEEPEDPQAGEVDLAYEAEIEARAEEWAARKCENRANGRPYVIDYDEYNDGPEEYERQFLYYYSVDRVLCEDDDSEVEEEEELVGLDYEDTLDMQTTVWVRNDTLSVLYEIHRVDASYKDTVVNARETPREREFRILGRRKQALDD